jgi:Holliday junction resolvase RusA-like endonuclease
LKGEWGSFRCGESRYIRLPVPPSNNKRQNANRSLTVAAREYLDSVPWIVFLSMKALKADTATSFRYLDVWMILPPRYDCHNGLKVLCDALQRGRFVKDDRLLLPRIQGVAYAEDQEVVIKV